MSIPPALFTLRYKPWKAPTVLALNIFLTIVGLTLGYACFFGGIKNIAAVVLAAAIAVGTVSLGLSGVFTAFKKYAPEGHIAYELHQDGISLPRLGFIPWADIRAITFTYPRISVPRGYLGLIYGVDERRIRVNFEESVSPALRGKLQDEYGIRDLGKDAVETAFVSGLVGGSAQFIAAVTHTRHVAGPKAAVDTNDTWFAGKVTQFDEAVNHPTTPHAE